MERALHAQSLRKCRTGLGLPALLGPFAGKTSLREILRQSGENSGRLLKKPCTRKKPAENFLTGATTTDRERHQGEHKCPRPSLLPQA